MSDTKAVPPTPPTPAVMPRIIIDPDTQDNWDRWGRLVMTWATGKNYLNDHHTYTPPTNLSNLNNPSKFMKEVGWAGVKLRTEPASVTNFNVTQWSPTTSSSPSISVMLPTADQIAQAEANVDWMSNTEAPYKITYGGHLLLIYPLPCFYRDVFPCEPAPLNCDQVREFLHSRIGEYTINNCQ